MMWNVTVIGFLFQLSEPSLALPTKRWLRE
jgi:hypothetical protein